MKRWIIYGLIFLIFPLLVVLASLLEINVFRNIFNIPALFLGMFLLGALIGEFTDRINAMTTKRNKKRTYVLLGCLWGLTFFVLTFTFFYRAIYLTGLNEDLISIFSLGLMVVLTLIGAYIGYIFWKRSK